MIWEQLLSLKRFGDTHKRLRKEQDETRLGFEVDYDRIVFSKEFRSLQDKTQVIPMSKTDFVHTRLTHSLEVSVVARSLGRKVGQQLLKKYPYLSEVYGYEINDFGAIVAAAALAHDIGNPPFGHSGEKAIGEFFKSGKGRRFKEHLTAKQFQDMCTFEGNANGFKILTESRDGREGGLRLSYATLGAFIKYPKESLPVKPSKHICDKKFGVFQSETAHFNLLAEELGLISRTKSNDLSYCRHPLAYLVEAADDICYTIIDFEDGINLGLIQEEYALEYLINLVRDSINKQKYAILKTVQDRVSYLRALAINTLINECAEIFMKHEATILKGELQKSLLDYSKYQAQITDIINISVSNIYQSKEVVNKELAGYKVLNGLLDIYTGTVEQKMAGKITGYDQLIFKSLPETVQFKEEDLYFNLMSVCSYISKLSDTNAILAYRRFSGDIIL
jgi:dGTPase